MVGYAVTKARSPWLRAAVHAAIAMVVILLAAFLCLFLGLLGDPEAAGEIAGSTAVWVGILVLFASVLLQRGKVLFGLLVVAPLIVLIPLFVVRMVAAGRGAPVQLTRLEKAPPKLRESDGVSELCDAALGFSVYDVGAGVARNHEVEEGLNDGLSKVKAIGFAYDLPEAQLILTATKGIGSDRTIFEAYVRGYEKSVDVNPSFDKASRELTWTDRQGEYSSDYRVGEGGRMVIRCLASSASRESDSVVVCVQAMGSSKPDLERLAGGLALGPC